MQRLRLEVSRTFKQNSNSCNGGTKSVNDIKRISSQLLGHQRVQEGDEAVGHVDEVGEEELLEGEARDKLKVVETRERVISEKDKRWLRQNRKSLD
jgi:hypothetical protein